MPAKLKFFAALLLTLPLTANAALHTLQSTWNYRQFPSSLGNTGTGVFTFTVEDTTPINHLTGTAPFQNATYLNPITSATFTLGSLSLSLDTSKDNSVYIAQKNNSGGVDANINAWLLDTGGTSYQMYLGFEMYRDLTTLALANLNGLTNDDTDAAYLKPDGCGNPFTCGYALAQVGVQSEVPVPGALVLFGSALSGLIGAGLRKRR
jgi:hypothetical protein